ncbi:gephyrin-like molybdotransferase Glp [Thioflexithrix psekupsensis]|uniref:Molybdopterin molybdenumtransferase n=1 Tax=Thioflexithrix psekupsensis TaxID=1570016 RepID=A0A251X639_9GAMM|nr:gephyrin-like molybdotransferase Glp [Thioflexithrix psekupsensis]OUD12558.1 molybdopterin molybdenumtransferase MoeA [Thioflexithrix psekupsensis]
MLTIEQAIAHITSTVQPVQGQQQLAIREALGRVLAMDVYAPIDVPAARCSAMDGYAFARDSLPDQGRAHLQVVGQSLAGHPYTEKVKQGQCTRIFTGGVLPDDTDTVLMQEVVQKEGDKIQFDLSNVTLGQFVNAAGSDVQMGSLIVAQGKRLTPADIGLLASLGVPEVRVTRRLRVAFFSTGDELCALGQKPRPGQIYDSNRYTLGAMLRRLGGEVSDLGVIRDVPHDIEHCLLSAATHYDVIVSSGGVSVGEADYVTETLRRIGEVAFWKIAMKPGKPLSFGKIKEAIFFGLPGNPVAVMGTFYQCVRPALRRMMGEIVSPPVRFQVRCDSVLTKEAGRVEFQRGILSHDDSGMLLVRSTGRQNSNLLSSMSVANCFIVLPENCTRVEKGEWVLVEPFEGLDSSY